MLGPSEIQGTASINHGTALFFCAGCKSSADWCEGHVIERPAIFGHERNLFWSLQNNVFRRVRKIAKGHYWLRRVCLSVFPHGTTRLLLDGFSWKLIFEYSSKICRKKIKFSLKSEKTNGCFTWRLMYIRNSISQLSFWNGKFFRQNCRGNQNTFYVQYFFPPPKTMPSMT